MIKNYFKIAWRNMIKSKGYSVINIGGLAVGMAVASLIGLWMWDELSYDTYHANYDRIARVMQSQTYNGEIKTNFSNPALMSGEIKSKHGSDFKYVLQSSWNGQHTLAVGEKKLSKSGSFFEEGVVDMLSLKIIKGSAGALKDPYSILVNAAVAKAFFGDADPVNKTIKVDNKADLKIAGVYEDLPYHTSFRELEIIMPWQLYLIQNPWIKSMENPWGSNFTQTFAMVHNAADMEKISARIKDVKNNAIQGEERRFKPVVFLEPMRNWHLRADFKNGVNVGGRIQYVWLFGIVGLFVLLLACINFMNLSTARSEKRAREVGVRKAIGSARSQLIAQFFSESLLVVFLAFFISLLLTWMAIPSFNAIADKQLKLPLAQPAFWMAAAGFSLFTALVAGSYPALYLSSFQAVKVLKGTFRVGRLAAVPRKVMVVVQFAVSVVLIIGTIIVYRQIEYAKNRPVGYSKASLITCSVNETLHEKFEALRNELKTSNLVVDLTESTSPATDVWNTNGGFMWEGKDPNMAVDFPNSGVTPEYGKVIGWKIIEGRDFSRDFATDSSAFILNESAVKFIGFKNPVGKTIQWNDHNYTVVGVVKDILTESPYQPVRAAMFNCTKEMGNVLIAKMNPNMAPNAALEKIEQVFKKYDPAAVFNFKFVDEEFAKKFGDEERIGTLAGIFAVLAIFISCLGLFGLASFVAEQRIKEIGIRKVVGASVFSLWKLLSKDFLVLVFIACSIAVPLGWYAMEVWLKDYDYRAPVNAWIFIVAVAGALIITLVTVSFQSLKAAMSNPVKNLRTE